LGGWHEPAPVGPTSTLSLDPSRLTQARHGNPRQEASGSGRCVPGDDFAGSDRYPLELLQESCSDLGSRLFIRIREQLGLAYYVGAQNFVGLTPGYFAFYVGTTPEKTELVEKELLDEAALLRLEGLTEAELNRAKAKIIGQKKIARQDLGHLAMTTALDELYGLGFLHIDAEDALYEAVTLAGVKAAAQKYLKPDALVISTLKAGKTVLKFRVSSFGFRIWRILSPPTRYSAKRHSLFYRRIVPLFHLQS